MSVRGVIARMNFHSVLALAGMAGPLVLGVTDITAAFLDPGYSFFDDSISSLARTSLGWFQTIGFLAIGLLVEIFVAGLLFNIRPARLFHAGIVCLVLFGFGLLLLGAFHTDPIGTVENTTEGTIHSSVAAGIFWLFPLAIAFIAPSLRRDPDWRNIFVYTLVACSLDIILAVTLGFFQDSEHWFGLIERLLVANMIVWVEVAAVRMLRLSMRRKNTSPLS